MGKTKHNLCELCEDVIFNRRKHAKHCKECTDKIRNRSFKKRYVPVKIKLQELLAKNPACERLGNVGQPKLRKDIVSFILEQNSLGIKPKDIIHYVNIKFGVNIHRNSLLNYRKTMGGENV